MGPEAAEEKSHQWQGTAVWIHSPGLAGMVEGSWAVGTGAGAQNFEEVMPRQC